MYVPIIVNKVYVMREMEHASLVTMVTTEISVQLFVLENVSVKDVIILMARASLVRKDFMEVNAYLCAQHIVETGNAILQMVLAQPVSQGSLEKNVSHVLHVARTIPATLSVGNVNFVRRDCTVIIVHYHVHRSVKLASVTENMAPAYLVLVDFMERNVYIHALRIVQTTSVIL